MGKGEEEPLPPTLTHPQSPTPHADNCSCCCRIANLFRFKCVFVLVLGVSVLLSAVLWLPPFFRHGDQGDLDLDSRYKGHDMVATFMIQKPLSLLQDDFTQLGGDIFDEIRVPTTKVVILTAERTDESNTTKVIFGVDPDEYNSIISPYAKSLVRDSFVSLVLKQSPLTLTESLFGQPSSFEVLKFVGGITITPDQSAYPLQKNLHVSLTNSKGSTVAPHTTVQSSVVLVVGTPSLDRSKQLAQTIRGSPTKNLGLNNTQFGRVKQISLSSYFNSSSGGSVTPTPSPAPLPHPPPQPHHHHHHHHHHDKQLPPAKPPSPSKHSPVPTSAPHNIHYAKPPDCRSGYTRKKNHIKHPPLFPPVSQPVQPPSAPPSLQPPPPVTEKIPASGPLPNVVFAHSRPPSKRDSDADPPDISPLEPSSSCRVVALALRAIMMFVVVIVLEQK